VTGAAGEPDSLVQRAIESVLGQLPDLGDPVSPEDSAKYQPWAENVAPASKNKRPLSELLAEYAARIAADPEAVAGTPSARHPVIAFFDRFGPSRRQGTRRRGRGGRGGGQGAPAAPPPQPQPPQRQRQRPPQRSPQTAAQPPPAGQPPPAERSGTSRRRRRRPSGRRGRGGGGGGGGGGPAEGS
jgi:hypothetical protein